MTWRHTPPASQWLQRQQQRYQARHRDIIRDLLSGVSVLGLAQMHHRPVPRIRKILRDAGYWEDRTEERSLRAAEREQDFLKSYGMTREQFREFCDFSREERAAGRASPRGAYRGARHRAGLAGIGWELTIGEWWTLWRVSGKWSQRPAYDLVRAEDSGAYALGNVYISRVVPARESRGSRPVS